jgi:hypothetical protein
MSRREQCREKIVTPAVIVLRELGLDQLPLLSSLICPTVFCLACTGRLQGGWWTIREFWQCRALLHLYQGLACPSTW